jgi:integrase
VLPGKADMKLTPDTIAALDLPPGKVEAFFWDDDIAGFGLRLKPTRKASRWIFQYRHGRRQRRVTIGALTALSATQARKAASDLHAKAHLGHDPAGEKAEQRVRSAETMGALLKSYLVFKRDQIAPRSYVEVERHLMKQCKPLHSLPIAKLDRRAISGRKAAIATKSGNVTANRVHASLSAFLAWCMQEGLIDSNPALGATRYPEKSRDRVLGDQELKAIWAATSGADDYSAVVRLLILTGCRLNEIAGLRWSEIVDERIVLPSTRTKNGRQHVVPLAPVALDILAQRPARPDRDLIFGRRHDRPLCGWTVLKTALDKRIDESGAELEPWTHHDLRRTVATRMAELGVQPHVIEAVLNHVSGHKHGVAGVYNRSTYEREKMAALALWGEFVLATVEGRARKIANLRKGA